MPKPHQINHIEPHPNMSNPAFITSYSPAAGTTLSLSVTVNNAMVGNIAIYKDEDLFKQQQKRIGKTDFKLGPADSWKGHILTVIVVVTDINPNSEKMAVDFVISDGISPKTDKLAMKSKDAQIVPFFGTYDIS
jgi:hypothetical protein